MPFVLAGIAAYIFLMVIVWALCRIAGLSDEALDRERNCPSWCRNQSTHHHVRHIPPRGW